MINYANKYRDGWEYNIGMKELFPNLPSWCVAIRDQFRNWFHLIHVPRHFYMIAVLPLFSSYCSPTNSPWKNCMFLLISIAFVSEIDWGGGHEDDKMKLFIIIHLVCTVA